MKIIDLTQELYDGMDVYPGDPEVTIKQIQTLAKEGWRLQLLSFGTHIATHVNAPSHMVKDGKTLDDVPLDRFAGKAVIYKSGMKISSGVGVIFRDQNIDDVIAKQLIKTPPKFIGLSAKFAFDIPIEKMLLEHDIISFENLINLDKLPTEFHFYGFPLKIRKGDGSPVRAVAVIDEL